MVVGAAVMLDATYACVLVVLVNCAPGSSVFSEGSYCDVIISLN